MCQEDEFGADCVVVEADGYSGWCVVMCKITTNAHHTAGERWNQANVLKKTKNIELH